MANNTLAQHGVSRRSLFTAALTGAGIVAAGTAFPTAADAAPRPTLRRGSRGAAVTDLQKRLNALGYSVGKADGVFGAATDKAVRDFQRAKKLTADGVVGAKSWAALDAAAGSAKPAPAPAKPAPSGGARPTVRQGSKGGAVSTLQNRLNQLGYYCGTADGSFGYLTTQAVFALQKTAGLRADGVVGAKSWAALDRGALPARRITRGSGIEIDVRKNLLIATKDGKISLITNTSTASGERYKSRGTWKTSKTPRGDYRIYRRARSYETGELGTMYKPAYFRGGYAIHGSNSIPAHPASHGCARVHNSVQNELIRRGLLDNGDRVLLY